MKAIVGGLDRFVGMMWKGIKCDLCGKNYTGVTRSWNSDYIRKAAREDGWHISDGADHCPDCSARSSTG